MYLEDEGIATTGISLIREHSERMRPPRALWVPFELGRPLGAPGDPAFQRRVLLAAFDLLGAERGPVLADFPDDAPATVAGNGEGDVTSCPVYLAPPDADPADVVAAVRRELAELGPWYVVGRRQRGGSAVGASGLSPGEAVDVVAAVAAGETPAPAGRSPAELLRLAAEDLKAYYLESATAQPGAVARSRDLGEWLWHRTALGELVRSASAVCRASDDPELRRVGGWSLVPQAFEAAPGAWQPPIPGRSTAE